MAIHTHTHSSSLVSVCRVLKYVSAGDDDDGDADDADDDDAV